MILFDLGGVIVGEDMGGEGGGGCHGGWRQFGGGEVS